MNSAKLIPQDAAVFVVAGKRPLPGSRGVYDAIARDKAIERWNDHPMRTGWGMACGKASRRWCLDVDEKRGKQGWATLRALEAKHGPLPETQTALTPTGGGHLHFKYDEDCEGISNSAGRLGEGLDVRADGGYVLLPGSQHPEGGEYVWEEGRGPGDIPLAKAPAWLLALLKPAGATSSPLHNPDSYADVAWRKQLDQVRQATNGTRNDTLNKAAFAMGQLVAPAQLNPGEIEKDLVEAAVSVGLSEFEARGVVLRGLQDGMGQPRAVETKTVEAPPVADSNVVIPGVPLAEFMAEQHPPLKELCPPFLTAGSLTFISAAPGSLKTWLVMHLALETARRGHKVLMVLEEGRPATIQKRLGYLGGSNEALRVMVRKNLRIDDDRQWKAFAAGVAAGAFDVVLFDPFADFHLQDESDGPEMRRLINKFKGLIADTGSAVVVVHHTVKSSWQGASKDRPAALLSDSRGAGGQMGSADLALSLVRGEKGSDENVRTADIYVTKDKDNVVPGSFPEKPSHVLTLTFSGHQMNLTIEGAGPVKERQRVEREDARRKEEVARDWDARNLVRKCLAIRPMTTTELKRQAAGVKGKSRGLPGRMEAAAWALEEAGEVRRVRSPVRKDLEVWELVERSAG